MVVVVVVVVVVFVVVVVILVVVVVVVVVVVNLGWTNRPTNGQTRPLTTDALVASEKLGLT